MKRIYDYFVMKHHKKRLESLFERLSTTCRMVDVIDYHEYLEEVKKTYPALALEYKQKYAEWQKGRKEYLL